jgi:pyruvate/2-oxoglutarate dehydrogenase complex dihydrolipoamide dehydrogenase (E3) component
VAIQAGIYLARRLFGGMTEPMDYEKVCTTVFTPIEYSTVGISEDDAIERFGLENIEVYHREFLPLEWSLSPSRSHSNGFAKVIVDKTPEENVLGIHYLGPNAGEVMQGYGVAMKQGLTFKQLTETVGIHPTSSEELVTLSTTKSSGKDVSSRNHTLNDLLIYLSSLTLSFSTCRQRLEAVEARSFGGSDWCNNT